jgi:hypothetical protein
VLGLKPEKDAEFKTIVYYRKIHQNLPQKIEKIFS